MGGEASFSVGQPLCPLSQKALSPEKIEARSSLVMATWRHHLCKSFPNTHEFFLTFFKKGSGFFSRKRNEELKKERDSPQNEKTQGGSTHSGLGWDLNVGPEILAERHHVIHCTLLVVKAFPFFSVV